MMDPDKTIRSLARIPGAVLLACLVVFLAYAGIYAALPPPATPQGAPASGPLFPASTEVPAEAWSVFARYNAADGGQGSLAKVFRLAGTFFMGGSEGDGSTRKAVLDHLEQQEQFLVREGDRVASVDVVRIHRDHVVLSSGGREEELWLSFQSRGGEAGIAAAPAAAKDLGWDERVIETSVYGKRIAENRWILSRDALLDYHQAMLDDPERLAALFLSMKPDYQDDDIAGYRVDIEGEEAFFQAVGLGEGDIVREVNSMRMVSQRRAEYFIREFAQGQLSAVVLDIERSGTPEKLIYYIR